MLNTDEMATALGIYLKSWRPPSRKANPRQGTFSALVRGTARKRWTTDAGVVDFLAQDIGQQQQQPQPGTMSRRLKLNSRLRQYLAELPGILFPLGFSGVEGDFVPGTRCVQVPGRGKERSSQVPAAMQGKHMAIRSECTNRASGRLLCKAETE
jgi:hypothetical protein